MRRLGFVRAPHRKNTTNLAPEAIPIPKEIILPMSMHIGAPAKPIVKVGDDVKVGQLVGEAEGDVSVPIHSSVSGKVKSVDIYNAVTGQNAVSVTITSDGEQTLYDGLKAPEVNSLQEFLAAVKSSGAVGLGGAGFPTHVKLGVKDINSIEYILINGAECEPYITSDRKSTRLNSSH